MKKRVGAPTLLLSLDMRRVFSFIRCSITCRKLRKNTPFLLFNREKKKISIVQQPETSKQVSISRTTFFFVMKNETGGVIFASPTIHLDILPSPEKQFFFSDFCKGKDIHHLLRCDIFSCHKEIPTGFFTHTHFFSHYVFNFKLVFLTHKCKHCLKWKKKKIYDNFVFKKKKKKDAVGDCRDNRQETSVLRLSATYVDMSLPPPIPTLRMSV